jgi:proline iminopeptidase
MCAHLRSDQPAARDGYIPVDRAELYFRDVGEGQAIVVLHGGPDFDVSYLLPDMDRLSDAFRLIYYDQRGRGRSAAHVQPADVSIQSDVDDLERVRAFFGLETLAILGHSWGGLLAMEYATRYPARVSQLILLNTAFVSHDDFLLFREERQRRATADLERATALKSTTLYQEGDPDTVAAYYRIHFSTALGRPGHLDKVIERLRAGFTNEGILKARAIEERLMHETWWSNDYDLLPALRRLSVPTLVIHGDADLIPVASAANVAAAIPGAHLVVLRECGHFSYLERPDDVRREIDRFMQGR